MIVVLTGTGPDTFERLVKPLDELAGKHGWDVFVQLGHTPYEPSHCRYERFIDRDRLMDMVKSADIVIAHGGFGSIRDALVHKKPVIAVPRRADLNEVQDDHQIELVTELQRKGLVIALNDTSRLEDAIDEARTFTPGTIEPSRIPDLISDYLKQIP